MVLIWAAGTLSWGTNLAAWTFDFPTTTESYMWRICSIVLCSTVMIGGFYHEILRTFFPNLRKNACHRFAAAQVNQHHMSDLESNGSITEKLSERIHRKRQRVVLWLSNNSSNCDLSMTMPLRILLPALFCVALYAIARAYLMLEDLLAFRGQNPGVYNTVSWVEFLPHV